MMNYNIKPLQKFVGLICFVSLISIFVHGCECGNKSTGTNILQPPSNLTVIVQGSVVLLNWTASPSSGVVKYAIYRNTQTFNQLNGMVPIGYTTTTNYNDTPFPGTYYYGVTAMDSSNNESVLSNIKSVTVTGNGSGMPSPYVSPVSISFFGRQDYPIPDQYIKIDNFGGGTISWNASASAPWLLLSPTNGSGPGIVTATISTGGLIANTYTDTIKVTVNGTPFTIPTTLNLFSSVCEPYDFVVINSVYPPDHTFIDGTTPQTFTVSAYYNLASQPSTYLAIGAIAFTSASYTALYGVSQTVSQGCGDVQFLPFTTSPPSGTIYEGVTVQLSSANSPNLSDWLSYPIKGKEYIMFVNPNPPNHTVLTIGRNITFSSEITWSGYQTGSNLIEASGAMDVLNVIFTWGPFSLTSSQGITTYTQSFYTECGKELTVDVGVLNMSAFSIVGLDELTYPVAYSDYAVESIPSSLTFAASITGTNPSSQGLNITTCGNAVIPWTASTDVTWATLSPTTGITPSTITVSVDKTGFTAPGTYTAGITISATSAPNSPILVPVTLQLNP